MAGKPDRPRQLINKFDNIKTCFIIIASLVVWQGLTYWFMNADGTMSASPLPGDAGVWKLKDAGR